MENNGIEILGRKRKKPRTLTTAGLIIPSILDTNAPNIDTRPSIFLIEFVQFEKLSTELRLKIWHAAIPGPRIIKIVWRDIHSEEATQGPPAERPALKVVAKLPAIMQVNSEARNEALKTYVLAFKNHPCIHPMYMDFERDSIFIENEIGRQLFIVENSDWMTSDGLGTGQKLKHIIIENSGILDCELPLGHLKVLKSFCFASVDETHDMTRYNFRYAYDVRLKSEFARMIQESRLQELGVGVKRLKIIFSTTAEVDFEVNASNLRAELDPFIRGLLISG